jgi:phenylalanyl-tRNA synthetase beta chain
MQLLVFYDDLTYWLQPIPTVSVVEQSFLALGLEVISQGCFLPDLSDRIVFGDVITIAPHPQADRLKLVTVDVGLAQPCTIVCGASNLALGGCVAVALPGAVLANGVTICESRIRGVVSQGMLCSPREIGWSVEEAGIWHLPKKVGPLGMPIKHFMPTHTAYWWLDIAPHRPECCHVYGLAKSISDVLQGVSCRSLNTYPVKNTPNLLNVDNDRPFVYGGAHLTLPSGGLCNPLVWQHVRLRQPYVHPVVDFSNDVAYLLGQPLHIFDYQKLVFPLNIQHSLRPVACHLLNGQSSIPAGMPIVYDAYHTPVAQMGVSGSMASSVTSATRSVWLECAWTNGIVGPTEAAARFMRGVSCHHTLAIFEHVLALLASAGCIVHEACRLTQWMPPATRSITVPETTLNTILGDTEPSKLEEGLVSLYTAVLPIQKGWQCDVPTYRMVYTVHDVAEDLLGYKMANGHWQPLCKSPVWTMQPIVHQPTTTLQQSLCLLGYTEQISFTFLPSETLSPYDTPSAIRLSSPMSSEQACLRHSVLQSLLWRAHKLFQTHHDLQHFKWYEMGSCFQSPWFPKQVEGFMWSGLIGSKEPLSWHAVQFDILSLLSSQYPTVTLEPLETFTLFSFNQRVVHVPSSAWLNHKGVCVGVLLTLKAACMASTWQTFYAFEGMLSHAIPSHWQDMSLYQISCFPEAKRDVAFWMPPSVHCKTLTDAMLCATPLLKRIVPFDDYTNASGQRSVACHLYFQSNTTTLTDGMVKVQFDLMVEHVSRTLSVTLRDH